MKKEEVKQTKIVSSKRKGIFSQKTESRQRKKKRRRRLSRLNFEEKIVQIKRVTKVVKGGKKLTFRATVIIGDKKRKVGVGIGRADNVNLAIEKAVISGKKNLINAPITKTFSIPHVMKANYGASKLMLRPSILGAGVIAGASIRTVLELAGIQNIVAKQFGSNNILNNAKASVIALTKLSEKIALGKSQSVKKQEFYNKLMRKYKKIKNF